MNRYRIKIANIVFEIETVHTLSMALSRQYFTDEAPNIFICSTPDEVEQEKRKYISENGLHSLWDGNAERIVVLRKIAEEISEYNAFVMHGAVIGLNNQAYIFSGRSGVGKTTHIRKWLKNIPNSVVINGDKPFIYKDDKEFMACGSPWSGKENMNTNVAMPIKAITFLERAEENYIQRILFSEAFPLLYQQVYRSMDGNKIKKTLMLLKDMSDTVSFYKFRINNFKDDCFNVAYNALVRGAE